MDNILLSKDWRSGQTAVPVLAEDVCRLLLPSFQLKQTYPAAMGSLTQWYAARRDLLGKIEIGMDALSMADLLSPNM